MASKVEYEDESRTTMDTPSTEDNAPKAIPIDESPPRGVKREHEVDDIETPIKIPKTEADDKDKTPSKATKAAITVSLDELRDGDSLTSKPLYDSQKTINSSYRVRFSIYS